MVQRLFSAVALSLFALTGHSIAEEVGPAGAAESNLRIYIDQRWLYGNPEQMLDALYYRVYQIPVNGMQLSVGRVFSKDRNAAVVSDFVAHAIKANAIAPTQDEAQRQFHLWGDCLVKAYRSKFEPNELEKLQRHFEAGAVRFFPQFGRAVEAWDFEAMQRASGLTARSPAVAVMRNKQDATGAEQRQERVYLAISNPVNEIAMGQFANRNQASAIRDELAVAAMELQATAASLGVEAKTWAEIEAYAMSDFPHKEKMIYRSCENDPAYLTKPMRAWFSGVFGAMLPYFDKNRAALSRE